ncbi:hypothetical protein FA95DRAFT_1580864 [Auriscalpium vulgare]|uniref:Uncharacterized protein n=1 Tax=Auriscalpium vulgare TaxID=40419 RepID=A0ACB8S4P6_9AGAM|nr:hypothetical protein FA95DRAFT_1580864 [Auriscalpium vulgare]
MAPKEPTRQQLSSRLTYSQTTPSFLQKFAARVAGAPEEDDDDEFEDDGSGRPPIPKRPAIPERPADDPGSADEDNADEAPQVVVLKTGKHLTSREVENEKRKAKGLPPLPDTAKPSSNGEEPSQTKSKVTETKDTKQKNSLSFSTGPSTSASRSKRKAVGGISDEPSEHAGRAASKKKVKKIPKVGLSFADDA